MQDTRATVTVGWSLGCLWSEVQRLRSYTTPNFGLWLVSGGAHKIGLVVFILLRLWTVQRRLATQRGAGTSGIVGLMVTSVILRLVLARSKVWWQAVGWP